MTESLVPPITDKRVQRRVKRLEKRRREELPLFATNEAVLEQVAPAPVADAVRASLEQLQREVIEGFKSRQAYATAKYNEYRSAVAGYLSADQMAYMDAYCARTYPPDPLYAAEYWHKIGRWLGVMA